MTRVDASSRSTRIAVSAARLACCCSCSLMGASGVSHVADRAAATRSSRASTPPKLFAQPVKKLASVPFGLPLSFFALSFFASRASLAFLIGSLTTRCISLRAASRSVRGHTVAVAVAVAVAVCWKSKAQPMASKHATSLMLERQLQR